jgi:hypothetical protein
VRPMPYVADAVWHACPGCGAERPFPLGVDGYAARQWRCGTCWDAERAAAIIAIRAELDVLKARLGA